MGKEDKISSKFGKKVVDLAFELWYHLYYL